MAANRTALIIAFWLCLLFAGVGLCVLLASDQELNFIANLWKTAIP